MLGVAAGLKPGEVPVRKTPRCTESFPGCFSIRRTSTRPATAGPNLCAMSSWRRRRAGAGRIGLLPLAAFAVHQLRYELAYGGRAGLELRETGHSYLHSIVPWLVALLALSAGGFVWLAAEALRGGVAPRGRRRSFLCVWAICTAALILIFAGQETLEGIFAAGHPGGFVAVFGDGGWWAVPVAGGIGLLLALVFRGARWVVRALCELRRAHHPRPQASASTALGIVRTFLLAPAPLAAGRSTRGPPV